MSDLSTPDLFQMYRQLKPLLALMEHSLVQKGAIHCPKCERKHPGRDCGTAMFSMPVAVSA